MYSDTLKEPKLPPEGKNWRQKLFKTKYYTRTSLYYELVRQRTDLIRREKEGRLSVQENPTLQHCCTLCNLAIDAFEANNRDASWRFLKLTDRMEIYLFNGNECKARTELLDKEQFKLEDWRGKAIVSLIDPIKICNSVNPTDLPEYRLRLEQAQGLFDAYFDDEYLRSRILRRRLDPIWVGFFVFIIFLLVASFFKIDWGLPRDFLDFPEMLLAVIFGLFGAGASVASDLVARYTTSNLPKQFYEEADTLRRISFGPVAALIVLLAADAKIIPFLPGPQTGALICTYAFVAGFSERLVLKIVEKVGGPK